MTEVRGLTAAAVFVTMILGACRAAPSAQAGAPVARIDGRPVTASDVDAKWKELDPAGFMRHSADQYEARRRALDEIITDTLIARAAAAKGLSKEAFLREETARRAKAVSEAEIEQTFKSAQSRYPNATLDQLRAPIKAYLEEQQRATVVRALVEEVKKAGATVEVLLDPPRQEIAVDPTDPVLGPATAAVEIVEFSDFQCPFCVSVAPTLKQVRAAFGDKVKLVYRDLPLVQIHPNAFPAAEAAQCAREQGKFWEYHDRLFANQKALDTPNLKKYAAELGLDTNKFDTCLDEHRMKPLVEADMQAARRYGVESTPAFFINGRALMGALPFETFRQAIQDELDRKAAKR